MKEYRMKCTRCGQINEEMNVDYVDGGYKGEPHYSCPYCGHDDWDEVFQCAECGEWFTEDELLEDLCRDCFDKAADVDTVKEYGADSRDAVEVNGLYSKAFTQSQIDSILARAFAELTAAQQRSAAVEMCEDDPQAFADWRRSA